MGEAGFVEGQNIAIEYRWADDQFDRLPALAADLVRRQVAAIVCNGVVAQVAKAATTIPKVAVVGVLLDPSFLDFKSELKDVEEAGRSIGRQMLVLKATNEHEINEAFASIVQAKAGAILVGAGPNFLGKRREIIALAPGINCQRVM